jgi:tetratricopeptide (TPR) repeat protein/predicted aspartyl protease
MPQSRLFRLRTALVAVALLAVAWTALWPALAPAADPQTCKLKALVELPVTMIGTRPTVTVKINGKEGRFLIDSGASFSQISPVAAEGFGLRSAPVFNLRVRGVGGAIDARSADVREFTIGGATLKHVDFLVGGFSEDAIAGILGENVLGGRDLEFDLANGVVRLFMPDHCGSQSLAYWAQDGVNVLQKLSGDTLNDRQIYAVGALNGQRIRLVFDSGADRSVLTLRAAARGGVTPQTPGAVYAGETGGIGSRKIQTWVAPFDSFKLGGEEVTHTRLRIGGVELQNADMLLGADFFLSHRIYIANSQSKIYFTYNGGQVFQLEATPRGAPVTDRLAGAAGNDPATTAEAPANMDLPTDAAGFERRAAAFVGRRDFPHAIEDLTRAIALAPSDPQPLYDRAVARINNRQPILAMSDLDAALKLKPDHFRALLARAVLYNASGDKVHARADLDEAARIGPPDPQAALALADDYGQFGFRDEAIAAYDRWLAANPKLDPLPALDHRCQIRAAARTDLDKALADCNAALKRDPRAVNALRSRALVHFLRSEFDGSIADFDAILRLQPKAAIALYGKGAAEARKGLKDAGDVDIAAATALAPKIDDQAKRLGLIP